MELKKAWTTDLEKILWDQAAHSRGSNNNTTTYLNYKALLQFTKGFTGKKKKKKDCEYTIHSRAAYAGEGVHGNGPQTFYGHSTQ